MADITLYVCWRPNCPICNRLHAALFAAGHRVEVVHNKQNDPPLRIEVLADGVVYEDLPEILTEFLGEDVVFTDMDDFQTSFIRFLEITDETMPLS